jgi:hypothetical protein
MSQNSDSSNPQSCWKEEIEEQDSDRLPFVIRQVGAEFRYSTGTYDRFSPGWKSFGNWNPEMNQHVAFNQL